MSINEVLAIIATTLAASVFIAKVLAGFLPHFFRAPPAQWRLRVNKAMMRAENSPNKVPALDFGWKNGSVRRQMIRASYQPSAYTNKTSTQKLVVGTEDRANRESFVNRLAHNLRTYDRKIYGYFHPYCNAGGGGEKVLWKAVETTLQKDPNGVVAIYTGDSDVSGEEILSNVIKRFEYNLDASRIVFIFLTKRDFVDPKKWPRLTLLGQAFGSAVLAAEALFKLTPDVWCDTMGYPFTYPIVHFLVNVPVVTYTHYPVISSDMLQKLVLTPGFKNNLKLRLKYYYWKIFMLLYTFTGKYVTIATTNSTWTQNHISRIWPQKSKRIIYPPCSTENLAFGEDGSKWTRKNQAVIIAQFRPEKRHNLIIRSFGSALKKASAQELRAMPKLIFIGSTRGQNDRNYVETLKTLSYETLGISNDLIEFKTDCEYEEMKEHLRMSSYGINAMWNEHFGIAVVEYIASGLIPLVHASAGPLLDIVVPWDSTQQKQANNATEDNRTGFFFRDPSDPDFSSQHNSEYPTLESLFIKIMSLTNDEKLSITRRGKNCVLNKFSDQKFAEQWRSVLEDIPPADSAI